METLQLGKKTRDWLSSELEDTLEELRDGLTKHEAAQVTKGYLSTNVGAFAATTAVIVGLLAFPPTQKVMTSFIAFIRMQIAGIAKDIAAEFVPTPEQIVDEVGKAAEGVGEAAKEMWDKVNEALARAKRQQERREGDELPLLPEVPEIPSGPDILETILETILQALISAGEALGGRRFDPRKDPLFDPGEFGT